MYLVTVITGHQHLPIISHCHFTNHLNYMVSTPHFLHYCFGFLNYQAIWHSYYYYYYY